jgi:hypothetical protein
MAPLLLVGAAIGAATMYLFDLDRGGRRRALLRDQAMKVSTNVRDVINAGSRDLGQPRVQPLPGRARSLLGPRKGTDDVLVERVRSKMGRYVGHPGAIEITAANGHVTFERLGAGA